MRSAMKARENQAMAFNGKSFFAGVGTVMAALVVGFGASTYFASSVLGPSSHESAKLERRSAEPAPAAAAIVPPAQATPATAPVQAQAAAPPAAAPVQAQAAPPPAAPPVAATAAPRANDAAEQQLRASRAELAQPTRADGRRQARTRSERRQLRAERRLQQQELRRQQQDLRRQQQQELRVVRARPPVDGPPEIVAGRDVPFSPFRFGDD
jgi:hypothetical protein